MVLTTGFENQPVAAAMNATMTTFHFPLFLCFVFLAFAVP